MNNLMNEFNAIQEKIAEARKPQTEALNQYKTLKTQFAAMAQKIHEKVTIFHSFPDETRAAKQAKFSELHKQMWVEANKVKFKRDKMLAAFRQTKKELNSDPEMQALWNRYRELYEAVNPDAANNRDELDAILDTIEVADTPKQELEAELA